MKIYLVGGAVRDELLDVPIGDRDWVVVGAEGDELLERGFAQIGRAFPVFLHPETKEQYALARTESKTGPGHTGFEWKADSSVTLEQDLFRRDLTINAIAKDPETDELIDPYNGVGDLEKRTLHHVSERFVDDPLRVFRLARFAARLPNFTVDEATVQLARTMHSTLGSLTSQRVWQEYSRAMREDAPHRFFEVIESTNAVDPWFKGFDLRTTANLIEKRGLRDDAAIAAIGWCNELQVIDEFIVRFRPPRLVANKVLAVCESGRILESPTSSSPEELLTTLTRLGAFRREASWSEIVQCVQACSGHSLQVLQDVVNESKSIQISGVSGAEYGLALKEARLQLLSKFS